MTKTVNTYEIPIPKDAITAVVTDNESHQGIYEGSVDFAVPLNTPVLAAQDGTVTRVRDDSDRYGPEPSFGPEVNYITIRHPHGEVSEYLHLAKGSALVKLGDKVQAGQQIAQTGLSGWLYVPHLHFMVYEPADDWHCLEVRFNTVHELL
jgi:murein DD-endopeptidase MepM/ murein hydrolase activator NlpD